MRGSLAIVFDEMGLVQDDARPVYALEPLGLLAQNLVIDDHPSWLRLPFLVEAENLNLSVLVDKQDLAPAGVRI